jgi:hypothetical protein
VKVFLALARPVRDGERVAAFVLAEGSADAVCRLRRHAAFTRGAPPPDAMIGYAEDDTRVERLAGARGILERLRRDGVAVIGDTRLTDR